VNVSPVNVNLAVLDSSLTTPLFWALNIACALSLACGGIIMLIYSLKPNKPYSAKLLGFGYKKPLYAVVIFFTALVALSFILPSYVGFAFPLTGSGTLSLPETLMPNGANGSVNVSAAFGWPFYFAIAVAGLCIAARVYHPKVAAQGLLEKPLPARQQ
jgi:hypothetical protein